MTHYNPYFNDKFNNQYCAFFKYLFNTKIINIIKKLEKNWPYKR